MIVPLFCHAYGHRFKRGLLRYCVIALLRRYGVSFEEAKTAFFDERAIVYFDPDHSEDEDRFILLGTSYKLNQIVVCHCFREEETKIGIISARPADKQESNEYWETHK